VQRRRTGRGVHIDLSQYEAGLQFLAPAILDYFVNERVADRQGNRHPSAVPHGVYQCSGAESWCAFSVWSDAEWQSFVLALGSPAWATDPRFTTVLGRKEHESTIDACISEWTSARERDDLVATLRAHGLHAAPVNSMADLFADPQLARRTWRPVEHPVLGRVKVMAPPFLLSDTPPDIKRAAPLLGQHTREVLIDVLGLEACEVDALEADGVLT
jgi:benzylsuccinate CoA-transferase BbsF subunit